METNQFAAILRELSSYFNTSLEPDSHNSCLIRLQSGLQVQIEPDRYGSLLIGIKLGSIPSSRYRELVFKEALKANGASSYFQGVFGVSKTSGQLVLFTLIDDRSASSERLKALLPPLLEKAQRWAEAIQRGEVPMGIESSPSNKPNIFSLGH